MTKLTEPEQQSENLWYGVVDALLKHIQHRYGRLTTALGEGDLRLGDVSLKAMHRAAKTLALFTEPQDD